MESQIEVYIGQDEEFTDRLCVDLNVSGKAFNMYMSSELTIDTEYEEFNSYLQEALNTAKLLSNLGVEICIHDSVADFADEFSEEFTMSVKKLCKEVL